MKKVICIVQMVILLIGGIVGNGMVYAQEPAWNEIWDPNMVDCIGGDGEKYTADQDYWILLYEEDGTASYKYTAGGHIQKKLRIACYDGTIHSVYCIGTGLPYYYGGDKYMQEDLEMPNDYYERLPEAARQGIWLTLQFGYEDGKASPVPDTNEDDYWLATQVLVWEYQQGIRRGVFPRQNNGQVEADIYYNMIKDRPAERCYHWILTQMETYLQLPSFVQPSGDLRQTGETLVQYEKNGRYVLELQDEYCTGAHFTLSDTQGNTIPWLQVSYLGEYRYRFESVQPIENLLAVEIHKELPDGGKKMLFFSDGSGATQVVACKSTVSEAAGKVGVMALQTEDYVEIGDIQIRKQVEIGALSGYAFEVRGENVEFLRLVETNDDGCALLTGLPAGWYQVSELLADETPWQQPPSQRVEVQDRTTTQVVFQNRLKTGALSIVKTFEGCMTSRAGVAFEIVGTYGSETVYCETVVTDEQGGILLSELPIGTYTVTELANEHTKGYALCDPVTCQIEAGETTNVFLENKALRGQFEISKTGLGIVSVEEICGFKKPTLDRVELEGCAFDVYAYADICGEDGTVRIPAGTWVEQIRCCEGRYLSGTLYPGVYQLVECVVAQGYEAPCDLSPLLVTILPEEICVVEVENVLKKYPVMFDKKLEDGDASRFQEVWFGLYANDSYVAPDGTAVNPGDLLCVASPDQSGRVCLFTYFPVDLYVQEIVTAEEYQLDETIYRVENGTIYGGTPLVNRKIPVNPTTGEEAPPNGCLWIVLAGISAFCFVAFYAKSRYNREV